MRRTHRVATSVYFVFVAVVLSGLSCGRRETPSGSAATDTRARIERGRYLVALGSCGDCHTPGGMYGAPDPKRTLAGSDLGWHGPWGVSYARNLTPDAETGIGKWTEDEIVRAVRTGVRPDGRVLLPPMPWPNYGGINDADAHAIAAYLKSLPAVHHNVPSPVPPDRKPSGVVVNIPPPPAWDEPRGVGGGPAPAP